MNKFLPATIRILLTGIFLMFLVTSQAQTDGFKNGVRTGMIKVKFSPAVAPSLVETPANARRDKFTTGIKTVDIVAQQVEATSMQRLFPYDARFEAKLRKHGLHLWYVVEIGDDVDPAKAASQFKQLKEVTIAEVEHEKVVAPYKALEYKSEGISTFNALPFNDPYLKDQWHYDNRNQSGFGDADINLFEAWTKTTGANNIIVSVHDEGVDVKHIDLKANMWVNQTELNGTLNIDDDGNGYIDDINGYNFEKNKGAIDAQYHGTHVAGTIAAVNNNGVGVSGVAGGNGTGNGVKIMSLQILGGAPIEKSYVYAANNGAVISQNSWGYTSPGYVDQSVLDAIDYFVAEAGDYPGSPMKGGIVIFAAGNSDYDADWYPQYHANTLSVAALGPEWKKAYYSNYGTWIELSAPGGDQDYGAKNGVLSTIPKDQYAYMQGTSMACPHVSGIAALALANRTKQLTNAELWNKLVTGVVSVDQYNENHIDKLGSGAIDASLAIKNDQGKAPAGITSLAVTGVAQEFVTLKWTVPADEDDSRPISFELYHHTQPITLNNLHSATKTKLKNTLAAGSEFSYELDSLLGLTTYYFTVTSTDRWGNVSGLSNVVTETTNQGPSIAVDENSQAIAIEIDVTSSTNGTHDLTIHNNASGILRWNHFMRHTNTSLSFNAAALHYPAVTSKRTADGQVSMSRATIGPKTENLRNMEPATMAFESIEKTYSSWPTNIIGETNLALTNSAGAKFMVTEQEGFNLTQVRMYLKHKPSLGPVIVEVFKGNAPTKNNLIYAQEHSNWDNNETWASITLDEQLYFESGSTFWLAIHVPAGNLFPLGIGFEDDPAYSQNCFMSFDMGATWVPLETAINSKDFAWAIAAVSNNAHLGTYLTLEPGSGDVAGSGQVNATLVAKAETLINGEYSANLVIASNDAQNRELRIPVNLTVSGHKPKIKHIDIADYGSVFKGTEKTLELVLENSGYGNFNDPQFSIDNSDFTITENAPGQIKAREESVVRITFKPSTVGNINGTLSFTNGDQTYQIALFGMGTATSTIALSPESQNVNNISIGDVVNAQITVQNTGAYPLKYFIPGFDEKGISENWPSNYHTYGYKFRTNYSSDSNPIAYAFQDISSTGVNITGDLKSDDVYYTLDMGFEFPFYGEKMTTLYIAQKGFTVFDNSVRPINSPSIPGNEWTPKGYISPLGTHLSYVSQGEIFYQVEADRVIIQFDNVGDGWNPESMTAQMVLFANGDIRFFYDKMEWSASAQQSLSILMEDMAQQDGVLVHNYNHAIELYSGLALGFDYPGPNIISSIENGSGILAPGSSAVVDIEMNTSTLSEGTINRYISFISNDPEHVQTSALIALNITEGGTAEPVVSEDTIAFGDVFREAIRSVPFTIKNPGTAAVHITNMNWVNDSFILTGEQTTTVSPGLYKQYSIQIPTSSLASLEDWLSINYSDGTHDTIYVTGNVVVAPAISVDLSTLQHTLAYGEKSTHPLTIENTGLADLEVATTGTQWMHFNAPGTPTDVTYAFEKYNDGNFYQWIEIRETGTHMPFVDLNNYDETFWRVLDLPFPIEFYGETYTSMKIGDNGIISFEDEPQASFFTDYIPSQTHPGACIMPYWTFSGFDTYTYPEDEVGIFYQFYDDRFIITWSYFVNNFGGMGDPVSAQMIFYKNGTMKFQYKVEEGGADITTHFGTIGVQKNSTTGIAISEYLPVDHGNGLAFILSPVKKYIVNPGTVLNGEIVLDATNIYGGQYNALLKIHNNVPNTELLEKPIELTVTGDGVLTLPETIAFEDKMVLFEFGSPVNNYIDLIMANEGSAPVDITWAQMTDATQGLSLQIWALVDGWFGPEWRWADISELYSPWAWETPVFTIKPGDVLKTRAVFAPSLSGNFNDELVLTTSVGEKHIALTGTAFEPPVINAVTDEIVVTMNARTETTTRSIAFDNSGASDLDYEVSIDFGRVAVARMAERIATTSQLHALTSQQVKSRVSGKQSATNYNRTLKHTSKNTPDTFVGTGGSAPFTLATQYSADEHGFSLSHVETWFRKETATQGVVNVEIRAGGTSIANAVLLASGSATFTGSGNDNEGSWLQIKMDRPAGIYPHEDFYVVVTYPLGIDFPQGTVTDEPQTPGRYFYYEEGLWYDVQEVQQFATAGWLMYAGEETEGNSSWLTITSSTSGTTTAGGLGNIELLFEGAYAQRGDQIANVVIKSNDPEKTEIRVPVKLTLDIVLGEEEDVLHSGLGVYPNPVTETATITLTNDWTGVVEFTLIDATGRNLILQRSDTSLTRETNVDVSTLSKGIYIIRAISATRRATIKLIKK